MNTLVLGGSGFIGSHLVERLLKDGHYVLNIDDLSTGREENVLSCRALRGYSEIKLDISLCGNMGKLEDLNVDMVFNLAAVSRVGQDDYDTFAKNYNITLNAIHMALVSNAKLVHFSSCASNEGHYLNSYAWSKAHGEDLVEFHERNHRLDACVVKPYNAYGDRCQPTGPAANAVSIFLNQYNTNQPFTVYGDGSCVRDYIHVDDVIDGTMLAVERNRKYVSLGTCIGTSVKGLIRMIDPVGTHPISTLPAREEQDSLVHQPYSRSNMETWRPTKSLRDFVEKNRKRG